MSTSKVEKLFQVVGTAINDKGELKVRWANDITQRISILIKAKCEDINLHELPKPMTKLDGAQWLFDNTDLTPEQSEVVSLKIEDKVAEDKRAKVKAKLTKNIEKNVKENKKTDPRIAEFIDKSKAEESKEAETH